MKPCEPSEIEAIAWLGRSLRDNPRGPASVSLAAEQIKGGHGERLFKELLNARREVEADEDTVVIATMTALEAMMSVNPGVAGYLMARLFPVAGRRYLHSIADGIDLWIDASTSADLADALSRLAHEGVRPLLRKRYESWAAKIRESQRPPG